MRTINDAGLTLLRTFEGRSLKAYKCPAGVWTIGYGHTGPDVHEGLQIDAVVAAQLLEQDLAVFAGLVRDACRSASTSENQLAAMICLAYNIGPAAFRKSSVLKYHLAGDHAKAAESFLLWNKATAADGEKRELKGLTRRRAAEAALYLTPDEIEVAADPQRTRAADVEPSPAGPDPLPGLQKIATGAGAVSATAMAASQVVAQVEPVWSGLQRVAGPSTPHILLGLIGLVAVLAICATVWAVSSARRAG